MSRAHRTLSSDPFTRSASLRAIGGSEAISAFRLLRHPAAGGTPRNDNATVSRGRYSKVRGFTLVELMLVAALLAIVGLTIVATFAGGLKIFNRMESHSVARADVLLCMEKMERDLRNTFSLKGLDFIGEAKRVTFPAILTTFSPEGRVRASLGSFSYFRDDSRKERFFSKEEKIYTEAIKKESSERGAVTALAPVADINFQYFSYDPEAETYSWVDAWDKSEAKKEQKLEGGATKSTALSKGGPEDLPLGVKIMISYKDGDKTLTLTRMVFIKTAVSLNRAQRRAALKKTNSKGDKSEP